MRRSCLSRAPAVSGSLLMAAWLVAGCPRSQRPALTPDATGGATAPIAAKFERRSPRAEGKQSVLLQTMAAELDRGMKALVTSDAPPYFMAYEVIEQDAASVAASLGALEASERVRSRGLDVDVRVGSYAFDNNRLFRQGYGYLSPTAGTIQMGMGRMGRMGMGGMGMGGEFPIDDDPAAIAAQLWQATQGEYRGAVSSLAAAKARRDVQVAEEDDSDDFSREDEVVFVDDPKSLTFDAGGWEDRIRSLSARFKQYPHVLSSHVELAALVENRYLVTTEGTRVQTSRPHTRLMLVGTAKADDGMDLQLVDIIDVRNLADLPGDDEVERRIDELAGNLAALRDAPVAEPFSGPAILEGRAAAVYFHEVFGHRVEGHRQKNENEGQTFSEKVGTSVMPEFMSVFDDPSIARLDGVDLNGHYFYDNEGMPGRKASLVENGTFVGFLMSRSPTRGFDKTNGHGRRQPGLRIAARQANLVVSPAHGVSDEALDTKLLERIKAQGKPYGLRFVDISGGVTLTSRFMPQVFQVQPVMVYRVYPDGREELVRGVTLEGTPLTSLSKVLAAGDHFGVFNGFCGAESGFVPVSAASPDLLLDQIEVARAPKSQAKPPLLDPPPLSAARARAARGGAR